METGFLLDHTHGGTTQSSWIDGHPKRSFWVGLDLKGRRRLRVTTYRCTRCGFLESFAPSP